MALPAAMTRASVTGSEVGSTRGVGGVHAVDGGPGDREHVLFRCWAVKSPSHLRATSPFSRHKCRWCAVTTAGLRWYKFSAAVPEDEVRDDFGGLLLGMLPRPYLRAYGYHGTCRLEATLGEVDTVDSTLDPCAVTVYYTALEPGSVGSEGAGVGGGEGEQVQSLTLTCFNPADAVALVAALDMVVPTVEGGGGDSPPSHRAAVILHLPFGLQPVPLACNHAASPPGCTCRGPWLPPCPACSGMYMDRLLASWSELAGAARPTPSTILCMAMARLGSGRCAVRWLAPLPIAAKPAGGSSAPLAVWHGAMVVDAWQPKVFAAIPSTVLVRDNRLRQHIALMVHITLGGLTWSVPKRDGDLAQLASKAAAATAAMSSTHGGPLSVDAAWPTWAALVSDLVAVAAGRPSHLVANVDGLVVRVAKWLMAMAATPAHAQGRGTAPDGGGSGRRDHGAHAEVHLSATAAAKASALHHLPATGAVYRLAHGLPLFRARRAAAVLAPTPGQASNSSAPSRNGWWWFGTTPPMASGTRRRDWTSFRSGRGMANPIVDTALSPDTAAVVGAATDSATMSIMRHANHRRSAWGGSAAAPTVATPAPASVPPSPPPAWAGDGTDKAGASSGCAWSALLHGPPASRAATDAAAEGGNGGVDPVGATSRAGPGDGRQGSCEAVVGAASPSITLDATIPAPTARRSAVRRRSSAWGGDDLVTLLRRGPVGAGGGDVGGGGEADGTGSSMHDCHRPTPNAPHPPTRRSTRRSSVARRFSQHTRGGWRLLRSGSVTMDGGDGEELMDHGVGGDGDAQAHGRGSTNTHGLLSKLGNSGRTLGAMLGGVGLGGGGAGVASSSISTAVAVGGVSGRDHDMGHDHARPVNVSRVSAVRKFNASHVEFMRVRRRKIERWLQQVLSQPHLASDATVLAWLGAASQCPVALNGDDRAIVVADCPTPTPRTAPSAAPPPSPATPAASVPAPPPVPALSARGTRAGPRTNTSMLAVARVGEYVLPGDVILFQCDNLPSRMQRFATNCHYDHVGIVVDAAWREQLVHADVEASPPCAPPSPTTPGAANVAIAGKADTLCGVGGAATELGACGRARRAVSVAKFFGLDEVAPLPPPDTPAAPVATMGQVGGASCCTDPTPLPSPHAAGAGAGRVEDGHVSMVKPPTHAHSYRLHLLEASGDGVRSYPLTSRLHAYGGGYTSAIAVRRLLLPGEEEQGQVCTCRAPCNTFCLAWHSAGGVDTGVDGIVHRRAGALSFHRLLSAATSPGAQGHPATPVVATSPASYASCTLCQHNRNRRLRLERRLGWFLSNVTGLPYRLTMAKLFTARPAHLAPVLPLAPPPAAAPATPSLLTRHGSRRTPLLSSTPMDVGGGLAAIAEEEGGDDGLGAPWPSPHGASASSRSLSPYFTHRPHAMLAGVRTARADPPEAVSTTCTDRSAAPPHPPTSRRGYSIVSLGLTPQQQAVLMQMGAPGTGANATCTSPMAAASSTTSFASKPPRSLPTTAPAMPAASPPSSGRKSVPWAPTFPSTTAAVATCISGSSLDIPPGCTLDDAVLASAVPVASDYYCSELLAACYMRMGLLPTDHVRAARIHLPLFTTHTPLSASATKPSTYWPNAWCDGGVVESLLPSGCRLDREVTLDCRVAPLKQAKPVAAAEDCGGGTLQAGPT